MLRRIRNNTPTNETKNRIWYCDQFMDLFVWLSESDKLLRFQLSYDKPLAEKSLMWDHNEGYVHASVDDGSNPGRHPSSPILLDTVPIEKMRLIQELAHNRGELPETLCKGIIEAIRVAPL